MATDRYQFKIFANEETVTRFKQQAQARNLSFADYFQVLVRQEEAQTKSDYPREEARKAFGFARIIR